MTVDQTNASGRHKHTSDRLNTPSIEQDAFRIGQKGNYATKAHWFEFPSDDRNVLEIWTYTDHLSYSPGDVVDFRVYCSGKEFSLEIARDGHVVEILHAVEGLRGAMPTTPANVYESGADWPVAYSWRIPSNQRSGPCVVTSRTRSDAGEVREQHHLFVIRPSASQPASSKLLMLFCTSTWLAYNEWGGANSYQGIAGADGKSFSPRIAINRPWARGFARLPEGAPHAAYEQEVPPGWAVEIPFFNWSLGMGYSKWYVGGSYAEYDRLFLCWAEKEGYELDYMTQHDLHFGNVDISKYRGIVIAGHDEYWSTEMRDALDRYVDTGGRVGRFGGNFFWQIRLEDGGRTQVTYKASAHDKDPVRSDPDNRHRLTTIWEDKVLSRPGALTMGLNGSRGLYARMGGMAPRHSGGFTVYRPEHWIFSGTDLYYGDVFGSEAGIFGFEVDGLSYTFRDGLPYPTGEDGAPADKIEILAMPPAVLEEEDHGNPLSNVWWRDEDAPVVARAVYGNTTPETMRKVRYGSGMVVSYKRGRGEVLNAGSCLWSLGLKRRDFFTERITHNVLTRFSE
ncbi:MAG: hypothetical protein NTZ79_10230 [Proteobacteria bacterium]|nr:hypothetical protein [Pseudomonadota bacterium]